MTRKTKVVLSGLVLATFAASFASAYALINPPRRWFPADTPLAIRVSSQGMAGVTDGNNGVTAAVGAANAWNSGGINPTNAAAGTVAYVLGDGQSDVIFSDPLNICTGNCLAATTTGYYTTADKGCCDDLNLVRITDADVCFNTAYNWTSVSEPDGCASEFYIETVTAHEVGHVIGLAHSTTTSALMYPSVSACNNKPLGSDDLAGRNALYDCTAWNLGACGGGGGCKAQGQACTANSECCSNSCKGKPGAKTCK